MAGVPRAEHSLDDRDVTPKVAEILLECAADFPGVVQRQLTHGVVGSLPRGDDFVDTAGWCANHREARLQPGRG